MAKITIAQAKVTYALGRQVYAETLGITCARRQAAAAGINSTTGRDLILNVRHMLNGRAYQRHMGLEVTQCYINWIHRDYGVETAMRAVDSVDEHLEYNIRIGHQNLPPTDEAPAPSPLRLLVTKLREEFGALQEPFVSPEEISPAKVFLEGTTRTTVVDRYERDPRARSACIKFHGTNCAVCSFNFETHYGEIGQGFIHVHHLRDLASVGAAHATDPKVDLRPVCPNCHAMLHKRTPPFSIEELRAIIRHYNGTIVRMYRDGCIEIFVPEIENDLMAAREKGNNSFDGLTKGWSEYAKHLNILFLCLEMACVQVQNSALLSHSELTRVDLIRSKIPPKSAGPSQNICTDSHVGTYQQGRFQGNYNQSIPPSFDIRMLMRRLRVVHRESCMLAFNCYCEIRKSDELFQNVSSLSKAVSEFKGGNLSTSTVLCWFILERCINERFGEYLDSRKQTLDGDVRIFAKRREFLTSSSFSAAVVSNVLELAEMITLDELQSLDEIRKLRNGIAHNLAGNEVTVDQCIKSLEFTARFLLKKVIGNPRFNLGLMAMGP